MMKKNSSKEILPMTASDLFLLTAVTLVGGVLLLINDKWGGYYVLAISAFSFIRALNKLKKNK